jgi:ParB-like chromosome segregation protein Spo0J
MNQNKMLKQLKENAVELKKLPLEKRIKIINKARKILHFYSPFKNEPVDCVIWMKADKIKANDYNPNTVAPPEMALLEHSISEDGYTQPIVGWKNGKSFEVVDGFHRNRVGRESERVKKRTIGFLPLTTINNDRTDRGNRIASTIRHNRARGKHRVDAMADIVVELKRRNWSNEKIAKNLGMDADEVLRLCQITGMAEAFADADFSKSWDIGFEENLEDVKFEDQETNFDENLPHLG